MPISQVGLDPVKLITALPVVRNLCPSDVGCDAVYHEAVSRVTLITALCP